MQIKQIRDRLNEITVIDVVVVEVAVVAVEIPSVIAVIPTTKPTVGGNGCMCNMVVVHHTYCCSESLLLPASPFAPLYLTPASLLDLLTHLTLDVV